LEKLQEHDHSSAVEDTFAPLGELCGKGNGGWDGKTWQDMARHGKTPFETPLSESSLQFPLQNRNS